MQVIEIKETKHFLSVLETARFLGVSTHTIYKLIDKGELNAVKISNRRTSVSADEIMNYIERKSGGKK